MLLRDLTLLRKVRLMGRDRRWGRKEGSSCVFRKEGARPHFPHELRDHRRRRSERHIVVGAAIGEETRQRHHCWSPNATSLFLPHPLLSPLRKDQHRHRAVKNQRLLLEQGKKTKEINPQGYALQNVSEPSCSSTQGTELSVGSSYVHTYYAYPCSK